ncbi:MAG: antitoxin Xre/MbcA/ParS toxin-binding domain-containing protein [Gaiellales bacterium]
MITDTPPTPIPAEDIDALQTCALAIGADAARESGNEARSRRLAAYRLFRQMMIAHARTAEWRGNPIVQELLLEVLTLEADIEADENGLDLDWHVRENLDRISQIVELLRRNHEHAALDDAPTAARFVVAELAGARDEDIAEICGVETRTIRNWRKHQPGTIRVNGDRVVLAAQLVYDLRGTITAPGIARWFRRPRHQLDGRTPLDLMSENIDTAAEPLRDLSRSVRGQLAA